MAHRKPATHGASRSTDRGNRRTRGGAGRHNLARRALRGPDARVRICLSCDRPFKSRSPWNRFCGRCRDPDDVHEGTRAYRVPDEWPRDLLRDPGDC